MEDLLKLASKKEEEMMLRLKEIENIKHQNDELIAYMEKYKATLLSVLDQLPHKVFLKDKDGKMALANAVVAKAHNMTIDEFIGKSDFDFVDAKTAQEWRDQELAIIKKGSETYIFDETLKGKTKTLKTTKMAFHIPHLNQTGLLGIQTDITELQELKRQVQEQKVSS
jgi:PAS domain S-box-containing protein